ncbi:hypothetical protein [Chitinophaga sp. LS1]|uniref:hypothetical protein n=1 Tax=Chitinophaga sp. LS1 TaxID=3051176 RepID=UPI002AABAD8B|nr:hypothetical protein [Chitinophaga sp. LS1]WPV66336.1 hypothetical protein QQL36_31555 [Chitinophaga sp. LS1]
MAGISIKPGKDGQSANIEMKLPVIIFKEQGTFIAHIPILDLSGYGNSKKEALDSLDIVLTDYICYAVENNTLHDDLISRGFIFKNHQVNPPGLEKSIKLFPYNLKRVLENKDYTKTDKSIRIPAYY